MNYRGVGKEELLDRVRLCSLIFLGDFQLKFFADFLAWWYGCFVVASCFALLFLFIFWPWISHPLFLLFNLA